MACANGHEPHCTATPHPTPNIHRVRKLGKIGGRILLVAKVALVSLRSRWIARTAAWHHREAESDQVVAEFEKLFRKKTFSEWEPGFFLNIERRTAKSRKLEPGSPHSTAMFIYLESSLVSGPRYCASYHTSIFSKQMDRKFKSF